MNNKTLEDIKNFAVEKLKSKYNYCGCALSDDSAMLNSGNEEEGYVQVVIKMED